MPNVRKGINDLATMNPELASEWDYKKNDDLKPKDVNSNSERVVWWKCNKCGRSFSAVIADRNKGMGCPYCELKK